MSEFVVKVPGVDIDDATRSELIDDIRSLVRLRVARDLLLKRSDRLLKESVLSNGECSLLAKRSEEDIVKEWRKRGWL